MAAKSRLTQTQVLSLKHDGRKGLVRLWDGGVPGFGVYVTPAGVKAYFVQYTRSGRKQRITIGKHGVLTVEDARKIARETLAGVGQGSDPVAERAKAKHGKTLREFWDSYLVDSEKRLKPKTLEEAKRRWKQRIDPKIGSNRLDEITRREVSALHRAMDATPYEANRVLAQLRAMFSKAMEWELVTVNPAAGVKMYRETSRERFLNAEEIQRLWAAIEAEEQAYLTPAPRGVPGTDGRKAPRGISPAAAGLFRLLSLTGARLSEIMLAKWSWIDWEAGVLDLPDSKTGKKRIALSEPALKELRRLWDAKTQAEWVIEGARRGKPMNNAEKPWRRVRETAGLAELRIHDLRHTLASILVGHNLSLPVIGKVLGHTQPATTARYAHLADDPIHAAVKLAGEYIRDAIAPPAANVEPLHPPKESRKSLRKRA